MRIELKDATLQINVYDLLENLSSEEQLQVVETLSCMDAVIDRVADQIVTGWTEDGSRGSRSSGAQAEPYTALDKAIRKIAIGANEVAEKEIKHLQYEVMSLQRRLDEANAEINAMRMKSRAGIEYGYQ